MSETIVLSAAMLLGIAIIAIAMLRGWQGWLRLKERELEKAIAPQHRELDSGSAVGAARIELADLKERIRKLEAIASGVDL